jgi:hypothetical protein
VLLEEHYLIVREKRFDHPPTPNVHVESPTAHIGIPERFALYGARSLQRDE